VHYSPILPLTIALGGLLGSLAIIRGLFDPDYFWHIATGRLILETGRIPSVDPFSFTWAGRPWIPDQWLSDVVIELLRRWLGAGIMLLLFGIVAAAAIGLVAESVRRSGVRVAAVVAVSLLTAATLATQITARPQVLSFPLLAITIAILIRARPERRRLLWLLPPIFLAWANLHGFFVIGLGVGFVYLVATFAGGTPMASQRSLVLGVAVACLVATAITPSGPAGIPYALTFGDPNDWGARNIAEWQSPNFHDPQFLPFLVSVVLLLFLGLRIVPGWLQVVALVGVAAGLIAIRSIGAGALMVMPALAFALDHRLPRQRVRPERTDRRWVELAAAGLFAAAAIAFSLARGSVGVSPALPVAGVAALRAVDPGARVLTRYGWGGYVINELYPLGGRVFVDGRMHKYAPDVLADYETIVGADPGWELLVARYHVEAILLRADTVLVKGIAQRAGWCEAYRDRIQVLLLRDCRSAKWLPDAADRVAFRAASPATIVGS
jgi:hypothetical protein